MPVAMYMFYEALFVWTVGQLTVFFLSIAIYFPISMDNLYRLWTSTTPRKNEPIKQQ
jgi:hypothetical protein